MTNDNSDLRELVSIGQIIERARECIDSGAHTWADAAAGREITATRNRRALDTLALVPQMLTDVGVIDTSSSFLGVPVATPIMLAPVGAVSLYHQDGQMAASQAAVDAGTLAVCGMLVGSPWEDVAATALGRHFFQLYVCGDRAWLGDILDRVAAAGFAGLVVTVDTPVIGRRDRALMSGFRWTREDEDPSNLAELGFDMKYRAQVTWSDFEWICERSSIPVVLKGVMSAADATRAVDAGATGIYVSNHGGRALDHAVSTIEVLSEVVEVAAGRADVMVDGGFNSGPDICKALALGAKAIAIGRLQCWGLGIGGQAGVARVLAILQEELETSMANMGVAKASDFGARHVRWATPPIN